MDFYLTPHYLNNRSNPSVSYTLGTPVVTRQPIIRVAPTCIHGYEHVHVTGRGTIPIGCRICCSNITTNVYQSPYQLMSGSIPPPPYSGYSPYGFFING